MRIIHVTGYYPPHLGGMENVVKELAEIQAQKGHLIEVFTSSIGYKSKNDILNTKLKINYLRSFEFAHTPVIPGLLFKLLRTPKGILHIHVAQAYIPEIVYIVSKVRKIPYVAHIHLDVKKSGKFGLLLPFYHKYILKKVLQRANKIICLTESQKILISEKYSIPRIKIEVIALGVNEKYFSKSDRKKANVVTHLLFVGRLSIQKNIEMLINASILIKNKIVLHIVGDGELMLVLKRKIIEKGLKNIILHGKKTGENLLEFYKLADIFILPSTHESFGLVLLEAMASGLPIVASDIPELRESTKNTAVYANPFSPEDFAAKIDSLIENRKLRGELAEKGKFLASNFTWDKVVNRINRVYEEITS